jgi:hypothetical protein
MRRPDGLPDDLDGRFDDDEDTAALLDEADTAPMRYSYGQDLPTKPQRRRMKRTWSR